MWGQITAWRAERESLKSILTGVPQTKLGRLALIDTLAHQIRSRMKISLPSLLSGLQGKSQVVQDELVRLGESMVTSSEGTRALALELCREFEDKFLQHIMTGEAKFGSGWKVVASFEGNFPNRIKQLPLDRHFDLKNVKRIVIEADGYQPYLISPEKGLRSLIKGVLELAKEPSRLCVDEVHRVLANIVSASANATPGLGRYPPFKREVVIALVDMERVFVPPQHFIRLVQRRMDRQRREEEIKTKSSKKAVHAEQSLLNRDTKQDKDEKEGPTLKTAGPDGEITAVSLHDFYQSSDFVDDAYKVFDQMTERNIFSWNTVLSTLTNAWLLDEAHKVFNQMPVTSALGSRLKLYSFNSDEDIDMSQQDVDQNEDGGRETVDESAEMTNNGDDDMVGQKKYASSTPVTTDFGTENQPNAESATHVNGGSNGGSMRDHSSKGGKLHDEHISQLPELDSSFIQKSEPNPFRNIDDALDGWKERAKVSTDLEEKKDEAMET
ncbi:hypothetical protein L1887_38801 [Cichorium endivia]|nr:hypothetical protein L1887_38801 [Cichorium endivia]